jgi:threonylcarbamoyladenosine tRNA methylthiotransferase MtaB
MFASTLDLVEACGLSFLHVFPFSPRQGTPAARMPQIARGEVKARAARLRQKAADVLDRHLARQAGRTIEVLVERETRGRAADFSEVQLSRPHLTGGLVKARVVGRKGNCLMAEAVA